MRVLLNLEKPAQALFLLVLAGFFTYHTLAAYEVIRVPLPLGGWWSYANVTTAVLLGIASVASREVLRARHLPFLLLCAWIGVSAVWNREWGNEWQSLPFVFSENIKLLAGWLAFYLLGLFLRPSRNFTISLVIIVATFAVLTPFLIQTDPFSPLDADRRRFNGEVANYQFFANALVFLSLAALAYIQSIKGQTALLIAASVAVFLLGSRSETIGMFLVAVLWGGSLWFRSKVLPWKALSLVAVGGIVALGIGAAVGADALSRYADAIDLSNSRSLNDRTAFLVRGLADIAASPFFGNYAGQMAGLPIKNLEVQTLAFGHYVHNALGMWSEHGVVPFLLFIWLSLWSCYLGARLVFAEKNFDPIARLLFFSSFYTLFLAMATKSIYWPMPAFAWGLAATACDLRQNYRSRSRSTTAGAITAFK